MARLSFDRYTAASCFLGSVAVGQGAIFEEATRKANRPFHRRACGSVTPSCDPAAPRLEGALSWGVCFGLGGAFRGVAARQAGVFCAEGGRAYARLGFGWCPRVPPCNQALQPTQGLLVASYLVLPRGVSGGCATATARLNAAVSASPLLALF